jgi:pyrroloquinoline quinone biosynthesis protein D
MTRPAASQKPRLARGCRLSEARGQEATLLMPEGALRLNGPGLKIIESCDGARTVSEILKELETAFPSADARRIEEDTLHFLETLHEKRAVDFE